MRTCELLLVFSAWRLLSFATVYNTFIEIFSFISQLKLDFATESVVIFTLRYWKNLLIQTLVQPTSGMYLWCDFYLIIICHSYKDIVFSGVISRLYIRQNCTYGCVRIISSVRSYFEAFQRIYIMHRQLTIWDIVKRPVSNIGWSVLNILLFIMWFVLGLCCGDLSHVSLSVRYKLFSH
jgi:hypothetical protein